MFVRFVVGADGEHHLALTGLFMHAHSLRDAHVLDEAETHMYESTYAWFNEHLRVPPFRTAGWPSNAVAWFRSTAHEHVTRMWNLAHVLEAHGQPVRMLRSANPGRVLYEDAHQIVVEEWKRW